MPDSIYYNVKPAKLAPNALKTAKMCELPNSKLGTVSIKILKNHKNKGGKYYDRAKTL